MERHIVSIFRIDDGGSIITTAVVHLTTCVINYNGHTQIVSAIIHHRNSIFILFLKMMAFWNMASCRLVKLGRRFSGEYCLHYQCDESCP